MAKKTQERFSDRVRFNWGYHDAAQDVLQFNRPRTVDMGPHSTRNVSHEYDAAYADGYSQGLIDANAGVYAKNSQAAWDRTHTNQVGAL